MLVFGGAESLHIVGRHHQSLFSAIPRPLRLGRRVFSSVHPVTIALIPAFFFCTADDNHNHHSFDRHLVDATVV